MPRTTVWVLLLLAVVLLAPACTPISSSSSAPGGLPSEKLPAIDSIPADWGNLVAVTTTPAYPDLAQLWLQDREGKIRLVVFNLSTAELTQAKRIGRQ